MYGAMGAPFAGYGTSPIFGDGMASPPNGAAPASASRPASANGTMGGYGLALSSSQQQILQKTVQQAQQYAATGTVAPPQPAIAPGPGVVQVPGGMLTTYPPSLPQTGTGREYPMGMLQAPEGAVPGVRRAIPWWVWVVAAGGVAAGVWWWTKGRKA